ncbi:MAG: hypothetical protein CMJ83_06030 [Planctomycetes bacterium]|nr:hypothetical protein [Planctomycetota bacterium]
MPELPEVESERRFLRDEIAGRRLVEVAVARDPIVFEGVSPQKVRKALLGRRVVDLHRRGKHLWWELDRRPWPCFHLGMTGAWHGYTDVAERPRFWKIELRAEGGRRVCMTNVRRLGRVRLREDPASQDPIARLGPDPLIDLPGPSAFSAAVRARRCPVKALLLDQSFAAGVGNWIADEVLFQARIDPRRRACDLDDAEARRIRSALVRIVKKAVEVNAEADRFPRTWLFHVRWGKDPGAVTSRGQRLRYDTIGGRTAAWCPDVQH